MPMFTMDKGFLANILLVMYIFGFQNGHTCRHVGNKTTFYDLRCSVVSKNASFGCNAGGQGKNCRYCGFDDFPECPTPAPVLNDNVHGNSSKLIIRATSAAYIQRGPIFGLAYSPYRNSTSCTSVTDQMIDADFDRIAAIADAIRIYAMECELGPKIVQKTREHGLRLILGVRLTNDDSHYRFDRKALDRLLLERSDLGHVMAVCVGQDAMAKYGVSETVVIEKIRDIRALLHSYGYQIPVTTTDVYEKYNSYRIVEAVDIMLPNLRVFSSEISAELSPRVVFDMIKRLRSWSAASAKEFYVGETGWPSAGDLAASPQSAWSYFKHFHCQARNAQLKYFYFEAFDAAWKQLGANNVDSHWGLGTFDRHWKPGFSDALRC